MACANINPTNHTLRGLRPGGCASTRRQGNQGSGGPEGVATGLPSVPAGHARTWGAISPWGAAGRLPGPARSLSPPPPRNSLASPPPPKLSCQGRQHPPCCSGQGSLPWPHPPASQATPCPAGPTLLPKPSSRPQTAPGRPATPPVPTSGQAGLPEPPTPTPTARGAAPQRTAEPALLAAPLDRRAGQPPRPRPAVTQPSRRSRNSGAGPSATGAGSFLPPTCWHLGPPNATVGARGLRTPRVPHCPRVHTPF